MSKISEILILVYRKIYSGFYPNLHETNLVAPVSLLSYVFETLNFIPYGFDSHFRIFNLHSNHERTFFGSFQLLL